MTEPVKMWTSSDLADLGYHGFAWDSGTGRCEILWCAGALPSFSYWISGRGRMSDPHLIRDPDRFGWTPLSNHNHLYSFAQSFARTLGQL